MNERPRSTRMASRAIATTIAVGLALLGGPAQPAPITATFVDEPPCDAPRALVNHELGDAAGFRDGQVLNEQIRSDSSLTGILECVANDGNVLNDWEVSIENISGLVWGNLYFLADPGNTIGNKDGNFGGDDAFRIDATGVNDNALDIDHFNATNERRILGDANGNLLFDPGETWTFRVTNFVVAGAAPNLAPTPFDSVGIGAATAGTTTSTASILAQCVGPPRRVPGNFDLALLDQPLLAPCLFFAPEPAATPLAAVGLLAMLCWTWRRRAARRVAVTPRARIR